MAFDYSDIDRLLASIRKTNAIERSPSRFKLTTPDGRPVGD